jgi:hypothetical protein
MISMKGAVFRPAHFFLITQTKIKTPELLFSDCGQERPRAAAGLLPT